MSPGARVLKPVIVEAVRPALHHSVGQREDRMMDKRKRDEILSYLPKYAFVTVRTDHFKATWTTSQGVFILETSPWSPDEAAWKTRVEIESKSTGESLELKTEDVTRIVAALNLLEAL
jgi:hypothetical protein